MSRCKAHTARVEIANYRVESVNNADMDAAQRLVDQATSVVIDSGNIINSFSLKNRVGKKSSDELADSVENTISAWARSVGPDSMAIPEPLHTLSISNPALSRSYSEDRRSKLKISAKIFLSEAKPLLVRNAVENVRKTLGVQDIDAAIVSFPANIPSTFIQDSFSELLAVWREMEAMVDEGLVKHIGVADFNKTAMDELYETAIVKPSIDQICATGSFYVPDDLVEFSEQYDVELLSHEDSADILPEKSFRSIMEDSFPTASSASEWLPLYAVRYAAVARHRGIVRSKGYIVEAGRKISHRYFTVANGEGYIA